MPALPTYPWFDQVPPELLTRNQLAAQGLRPGGAVVARVVWQRGRRWVDLYAVSEAKPKREMTERQRAALEHARQVVATRRCTCRRCRQVQPFALNGELCAQCVAEDRALEREIAYQRWQTDRATTHAWARAMLADPTAVVLDTETTDLDGWIVQIAVVDMQGRPLFTTLVNPLAPISSGATAVHGLTDAAVADAPLFAEVVASLAALLTGRTVIAYNAAFDQARIDQELGRLGHYANDGAWFASLRWACAMEHYAAWCGEWSQYWGNYRFQSLPGGNHAALGDARAALAVVQAIAAANDVIVPSNGDMDAQADAANDTGAANIPGAETPVS